MLVPAPPSGPPGIEGGDVDESAAARQTCPGAASWQTAFEEVSTFIPYDSCLSSHVAQFTSSIIFNDWKENVDVMNICMYVYIHILIHTHTDV